MTVTPEPLNGDAPGPWQLTPRRCVVSLATADRSFPERLERLAASLERVGFAGETELWRPGAYPAGCPEQLDVPFAFKPFCLTESGRRGAEVVLWLDSTCVSLKPLDGLFDQIERSGYLLFANGRLRLGEWCSDATLEWSGLSREQALQLDEVNAAAIGLDLRHPAGRGFLAAWLDAAREGLPFRGRAEPIASFADYLDMKWNRSGSLSTDPRVRGHRHDQTVAGILAHRLGMTLTRPGLPTLSARWPRIPRGTALVNDRKALLDAARGRVALGRAVRVLRSSTSGGRLLRRRR